MAVNALEVQPHVRSGKLRVLAVLSPTRTAIFPDTPTIAESGVPSYEALGWSLLFAPGDSARKIEKAARRLGVPAAPVMTAKDHYESRHLRARRSVWEHEDPVKAADKVERTVRRLVGG